MPHESVFRGQELKNGRRNTGAKVSLDVPNAFDVVEKAKNTQRKVQTINFILKPHYHFHFLWMHLIYFVPIQGIIQWTLNLQTGVGNTSLSQVIQFSFYS